MRAHCRTELSLKGLLPFLAFFLPSLLLARNLDKKNDKEWLLSMYLEPPEPTLMNVYMFNFTNAEEFVRNGEKPRFQEVGPYVYRRSTMRDGLKWVGDDVVEFYPKKSYRFWRSRSGRNRLADRITTVNFPLLSAINQVKTAPPTIKAGLSSLAGILRERLIITKSVHGLLWGYDNQLIQLGRNFAAPGTQVYPYDKVGLFVGANYTSTDKMTVATGLGKSGYRGQILKMNDRDEIGFWVERSTCNRIGGTDGFSFKEGLKKTDRIELFDKMVCRKIPFVYTQDVVSQEGLRGYRFLPSQDMFDTAQSNSDNACFCKDNMVTGCSQIKGLFDASSCNYQAPIMYSWPHLLNADPSLLNTIDGLRPDKSKHRSYIDVQPELGLPMKVKVAVQLNLLHKQTSGFPVSADLPNNMVVPLMWFRIEGNGFQDKNMLRILGQMVTHRKRK